MTFETKALEMKKIGGEVLERFIDCPSPPTDIYKVFGFSMPAFPFVFVLMTLHLGLLDVAKKQWV